MTWRSGWSAASLDTRKPGAIFDVVVVAAVLVEFDVIHWKVLVDQQVAPMAEPLPEPASR
ncbi:MAG: hypothetical protein M3R02_24610 [Chloroflexota bacterium]|nr:hypothetical protein [Chloroflexota bacterium]